MIKRLLVLLILFLTTVPVFAQYADTAWVRRYNGPGNGYDGAYAIKVDGSGNVYVTGYSRPAGAQLGGNDYATIKYLPNGDTAWVRTYNGPGDSTDQARVLVVDSAGNVYVTGFGTGSGTNSDFATIKYLPNGDTAWVKTYNGPGNWRDEAYDIALDGSGNVYVTGNITVSGTTYGYATIKYLPNGDTAWVRRYNGPGNAGAWARAIALDGSGNVYVTGSSTGSGTNSDFATIKYLPNGDTAWVRRYNGPVKEAIIASDYAFDLAVDGSGNVYVTGNSTWSYPVWFIDYTTIKYLPNGDTAWVRSYDGYGIDDDACALAVDGSGNLYVTGRSEGTYLNDYATIKYLPNGDTAWVGRYNGPGNADDKARALALDGSGNIYVTGESYGGGSSFDYATIKYYPNGDTSWVRRYNGPADSDDNGNAIAVDDSGNVYVTGASYDTAKGYDFATIKYYQSDFAAAVNYATGDNPQSVFCADLDGDSDLDLAVVNYLGNNISILKNNGDGTFQTKVDYSAGNGPYSVFCADLDGDADLDLAVANFGPDSVSILKNNGNGTFQTAVNYGAGNDCYSVFCADLDGDADLDLAVANRNNNNVSILKNNGDGTFQTAVNYGTGSYPFSVFCADLDGDTDLDLAVANNWSDNVSILKNNGDGTFQTAVNYGAGSYPYSVFCADLDGDADLDLAVTNTGSDNVSVLKNNGNGTFQTKVDYGAGDFPISIFCADLDGDTDLDLAVANSNSDNVSLLKNNGDGTFQTKVDYAAGDGPTSVFCADLDEDTDLDLVVAIWVNDSVSILRNFTQASANQEPWAFSLISPTDGDTTGAYATFHWQIPYDPNFGDQFRYDLHLSTVPSFDPDSTVIYDSLPLAKFTGALSGDIYYWKVKAYDNWGAEIWSTQSWSFTVWKQLTGTLTYSAYSPVDLIVTDPLGDSIGVDFNTIPGATYDTLTDYNGDEELDDRVDIPSPLIGEYTVRIVGEPGSGGGSYTLAVKIDGNEEHVVLSGVQAPLPGEVDSVVYTVLEYLRGDPNSDGKKSVSDVVFLINYLFKGGPAPDPLILGDCNCQSGVSIADVIYLVNYLFKGGPGPCS